MRWVAWVVVVSACAKPGGETAAPAPAASQAPAPASPASAVPVDAVPALPSASAVVALGNPPRDPKSQLCEVMLDGLTLLRPCTGKAGEKPAGTATLRSKRGNCLVKVGDLELIRPCEGEPNERKAQTGKAAPSPKMCEHVERTAEGDIVSLRPCPK